MFSVHCCYSEILCSCSIMRACNEYPLCVNLLCVIIHVVSVKQFEATVRSKVYSVTVTNGLPKLVIACYAHGQTQRSFLSIWRTVTVMQSICCTIRPIDLALYIRSICIIYDYY